MMAVTLPDWQLDLYDGLEAWDFDRSEYAGAAIRGFLPVAGHRQTISARIAMSAAHINVSVDEWMVRRERGEKWCGACRRWQPIEEFSREAGRFEGLRTTCRKAFRRRRP